VVFGLLRELQQYLMGSLSGTSVESMQGSSVLEQIASDLDIGVLPVEKALTEIGDFAN
jgi:hypothetical protein